MTDEPTRLVTEAEAASLLGFSRNTLRCWRSLKQGPDYVKCGNRSVRYPLDSLKQWQDRGRVEVGA